MNNKSHVVKTFTLTETHIELISKFYIEKGQCEACPPEVNQKRPWGNSDYLGDMAEILRLPIGEDEDVYENDELCDRLEQIFSELVDALQIVLVCKTFEPGLYEYWSMYGWHTSAPSGWKRAETNV